MDRLIAVDEQTDIPPGLRGSPAGRLLEYHNLGRRRKAYDRARLLIGMCMDHRKALRLPEQFAYVLRTGGANLRFSEFKVSYAIAVGGVRAIALIGHSRCGMSNLEARREDFVDGLVSAGWDRSAAEAHFDEFAPQFEIGDPIDFVSGEARRLASRYPAVSVTPMIYRVEDGRLYLVEEA